MRQSDSWSHCQPTPFTSASASVFDSPSKGSKSGTVVQVLRCESAFYVSCSELLAGGIVYVGVTDDLRQLHRRNNKQVVATGDGLSRQCGFERGKSFGARREETDIEAMRTTWSAAAFRADVQRSAVEKEQNWPSAEGVGEELETRCSSVLSECEDHVSTPQANARQGFEAFATENDLGPAGKSRPGRLMGCWSCFGLRLMFPCFF